MPSHSLAQQPRYISYSGTHAPSPVPPHAPPPKAGWLAGWRAGRQAGRLWLAGWKERKLGAQTSHPIVCLSTPLPPSRTHGSPGSRLQRHHHAYIPPSTGGLSGQGISNGRATSRPTLWTPSTLRRETADRFTLVALEIGPVWPVLLAVKRVSGHVAEPLYRVAKSYGDRKLSTLTPCRRGSTTTKEQPSRAFHPIGLTQSALLSVSALLLPTSLALAVCLVSCVLCLVSRLCVCVCVCIPRSPQLLRLVPSSLPRLHVSALPCPPALPGYIPLAAALHPACATVLPVPRLASRRAPPPRIHPYLLPPYFTYTCLRTRYARVAFYPALHPSSPASPYIPGVPVPFLTHVRTGCHWESGVTKPRNQRARRPGAPTKKYAVAPVPCWERLSVCLSVRLSVDLPRCPRATYLTYTTLHTCQRPILRPIFFSLLADSSLSSSLDGLP